MDRYHVRLEKENLVFSAAHFITFNGNICERLHGHNYRVRAEITGPLDENRYVIDFIALRDTLKSLVDELDHHMLLPTQHPSIQVQQLEKEVLVTFEERRWIFPTGDCKLLPLENTTAELLAAYLGERLLTALLSKTPAAIERIIVAVDENFGQWGVWEREVARP